MWIDLNIEKSKQMIRKYFNRDGKWYSKEHIATPVSNLFCREVAMVTCEIKSSLKNTDI